MRVTNSFEHGMLGIPFNLLQISYLTHMIAQVVDLSPGEVTYTIGDVHIYKDHIEGLSEQLTRVPYISYPTLEMNRSITNFDDFTIDDFEIKGYKHQGKIHLPVST